MVKCTQNKLVSNIFRIVLQVLLIFIFLTVFFFTYVHGVEQQAFQDQMNIVVNDLLEDVDMKSIVPDDNASKILIYGTIEDAKQNLVKQTQKYNSSISKTNKDILSKSISLIIISVCIIVLLMTLIVLYRYCIDFSSIIKNTLILVFFVAITELIFLIVITKNYQSVDPSKVREKLGKTTQEWIATNKKVSLS